MWEVAFSALQFLSFWVFVRVFYKLQLSLYVSYLRIQRIARDNIGRRCMSTMWFVLHFTPHFLPLRFIHGRIVQRRILFWSSVVRANAFHIQKHTFLIAKVHSPCKVLSIHAKSNSIIFLHRSIFAKRKEHILRYKNWFRHI